MNIKEWEAELNKQRLLELNRISKALKVLTSNILINKEYGWTGLKTLKVLIDNEILNRIGVKHE